MTPIFPYQRTQKQPGQLISPDAVRRRMDRLRALGPDQVETGLTWLARHNPQAFDSAIHAATQWDDGTSPAEIADVEPYCLICNDPLGVFLSHGSGYRHYRGIVTAASKPRPYKADHSPVIGWRPANRTL